MKIMSLLSLISLGSCSTSLPHRAEYELFPQANSPDASCPDKMAMYVDVPDGSGNYFLYCAPIRVEL